MQHKANIVSALILACGSCVLTAHGSGWVWNGHAGTNQDWSAINNWTDPSVVDVLSTEPDDGLMKVGAPERRARSGMSESEVIFGNAATNRPGVVTSVVTDNRTVGALTFVNTGKNAHTLRIEAGKTLSVNGTVDVGEQPGADTLAILVGAGALSVSNPAARFFVESREAEAQQGGSATLDASGLACLSIHVSDVAVGCTPGVRGCLMLAETNLIRARNIVLANHGVTATVGFRQGGTNRSVVIRGASGDSSRANLVMGDGSKSGNSHGTLDFGSAMVDALLGSVLLGFGGWNTTNVQGSGTLSFSAGLVDATTLTLGQNLHFGQGLGVVNVKGGVLRAKTIITAKPASSNLRPWA